MKRACGASFVKLAGIMEKLLSPEGCPWDRKQSHRTLIRHMHSEAREVELAVKKKDWANLEEELGDLLLQVVFHAELARRAGRFDLNDVVRGICGKLVRRHPHVFGGKKLKTARQVLVQWKKIKESEKRRK
ncbi:MAG: MazG nucleotide pyrophosphohydrolase domain-containing protein [Elusimicrobiales bacterium]